MARALRSARRQSRGGGARLRIEVLEDRRLLSAVPDGAEFLVNTYTTDGQATPTVAMDADGDFVMAWESGVQDSSSPGIYAQRYNAAGVAQGAEFQVNTYTTGNQSDPAVAMDADGDFVVAWESSGQDGDLRGIYAQRYNAAGVAQGVEFQVNTYTTSEQQNPSVAMDAGGDFVVAWESNGQDGDLRGIHGQRYNAAGVAQGAEFQVNTYTTSAQAFPSVAMDADGDFVVAWASFGQDGDLFGVFAHRYNAAGVPQGSELAVNTYTTSLQFSPSVAIDADGDFVVAWRSRDQDGSGDGVYAQRYNAVGLAQGSELAVNTYTTDDQGTPTVAVDADGDFVVAWESYGQDGSQWGVYVQQYNAAGVALGGELQVNTHTLGDQTGPSVAMDTDGDFVVAWESYDQDGDNFGVYAQRYNNAGGEFQVNTYTTNEQFSASMAMDSDGDFVVAWVSRDQGGNGQGIYAQRYDAAGVPQGSEFQVNTYITSLQGGPSVAMESDGDFVVAWHNLGQDGDGYGIYAQRYDAAGVPQGSEFQVSTYTTSDQRIPSVAMDADGDFVVAWTSYQDGDLSGVYAQRYDAAGLAQGGEFQVNTYTTDRQSFPTVAMDSDGDFVVAWESLGQDGSNTGVYAQRYNAAGVAQGPEFQVNTYTTSGQRRVSVTMDADGNFVVAWESFGQDGISWGVFAQRYNAVGVAQGSELAVNTYTFSSQLIASVAMDADGDFVVAWSSDGQDGSDSGVYAQRYNAAGVAQGSEFQVNSYTTSDQFDPSVAMDAEGDFAVAWTSKGQDGDDDGIFAQRFFDPDKRVNTYTTGAQSTSSVAIDSDGDFVVAWDSFGQDGDNSGVYAQRYDAAGVAQGAEFQVNTYSTSVQRDPTVAMDADGGFVVAWQSFGQDGDNNGVYAQRYDAAGVAQGSEFQVNTYTTNSQRDPRVAMDADGDFVVVWNSYFQDGGFDGVYAQRYDAAGVAQGSEFQVNTYTTSDQLMPSVAMDADGDFVVAWMSRGQEGGGSSYGVYAQRYNAAGVAQGSEFQVNTYTTFTQRFPSVAMDADGDFVVAWDSQGQDGDDFGIYAQRYDAAGVALGSEFRINTYTAGRQTLPTMAMDADGDLVAVWTSDGQDGDSYGVYARRYSATGVPQGGSEFQVNNYTTNIQTRPVVAMDADGDSVVAWRSGYQDGDSYGIYARQYIDATPSVVTAVKSQTGEVIPPAGSVTNAITSLVIQFSRDISTVGGAGGAGSVTNPANYELLRGITDISGSIAGITYGYNIGSARFEATLALAAPLLGGSYQLTARDSLQSNHGTSLDGDADGIAGIDFVQQFDVAFATVAARHTFYNASKYDNSSSGIDPADSSAIAIDKSAYLPGGGVITSSSMTSYSLGLNGIFVDLSGAHGTLSLADFAFGVSNQGTGPAGANNSPSTWSAAPAPTAFTVLSDTPAAGTDRVEFIWADNAIENRYLEVRTFGDDAAGFNNTNTGLAASDIFYFGNIVGDTFNDPPAAPFLTTAADETAIQASPIISIAAIDSLFDMDRNGIHLSSDRIVTRGNTIYALAKINIGNPPAAPEAPPSSPSNAAAAGLAVPVALTIPTPSDTMSSVPAPPSVIDPGGRVTAGPLRLLEEPDGLRALVLSRAADDIADEFDLGEALLELLADDALESRLSV